MSRLERLFTETPLLPFFDAIVDIFADSMFGKYPVMAASWTLIELKLPSTFTGLFIFNVSCLAELDFSLTLCSLLLLKFSTSADTLRWE